MVTVRTQTITEYYLHPGDSKDPFELYSVQTNKISLFNRIFGPKQQYWKHHELIAYRVQEKSQWIKVNPRSLVAITKRFYPFPDNLRKITREEAVAILLQAVPQRVPP